MVASRIAKLTKIPFGANEPLLHRALEAGRIGLWDFLPATGLIDLYHNVLSFQTLKPGRYYGPVDEFLNYIVAEDRDNVRRMLDQCDAGAAEVQVDFRIRTSAGNVVWLACRGRHALLEDGRSRYVGAIADITAATERELKLLVYHESLFSLARNPIVVDRADFFTAAAHILAETSATLGVSRAGLWQFNTTLSTLACQYQYDARVPDARHPPITLDAVDFPTYFAAISQRRALAVHDAIADPVLSEFRATYLPLTGVRALLDVPVFHHGDRKSVV